MNRLLALVREALAVGRSQPVATLLTLVVVAGMVASVLLTTGRTVGSEQSVLSSIDSAGTRAVVLRAEPDAGLTTEVLARLEHVEGISWMGAFGPAVDVVNSRIEGGNPVASRALWTAAPEVLGLPTQSPIPNRGAWASEEALDRLGMPNPAGGLSSSAGGDFAVMGTLETPDYLRFLEPLIVVPHQLSDGVQPVTILVVIAASPDLVAPIAEVVLSIAGASDPTKISLTTSEGLAQLRDLIEDQLGTYGRGLILIVFGVSALLVGVILYGLVILRRKDFGRRRALGASQKLIVALLLTQVATTAVIGVIGGSLVAVLALVAIGDPLPGLGFVLGVNVLAVAVATAAALLPALLAARREPIEELRVP